MSERNMAVVELPGVSNLPRPDRLACARPLGKLVYRRGSVRAAVSEPLDHARLVLSGAVSAAGCARLVRSVDPADDKPRPQIDHAVFGENGLGRGQCRLRAAAVDCAAAQPGADPRRLGRAAGVVRRGLRAGDASLLTERAYHGYPRSEEGRPGKGRPSKP